MIFKYTKEAIISILL